MSAAAKRAFFSIMDAWQVDSAVAQTLLGSPGRSTFFKWKKGQGGALTRDQLERISYILGIYKALQVLFPDPKQADAWIRKPNTQFGDTSALERMSAGSITDLHAVRSYLDYVRGGPT